MFCPIRKCNKHLRILKIILVKYRMALMSFSVSILSWCKNRQRVLKQFDAKCHQLETKEHEIEKLRNDLVTFRTKVGLIGRIYTYSH